MTGAVETEAAETDSVERVLVDTNVLVYSGVSGAPLHAEATDRLELRDANVELWISRQVLREYAATLSRPQKFSQPVAPDALVEDIEYLESDFHVADDDAAVTAQLLRLIETIPLGGKQVHDANIVAAMLIQQIPSLLTNNHSDFKRFGSLITVLPLIP